MEWNWILFQPPKKKEEELTSNSLQWFQGNIDLTAPVNPPPKPPQTAPTKPANANSYEAQQHLYSLYGQPNQSHIDNKKFNKYKNTQTNMKDSVLNKT